ncbi:MAG: divergent polysaccharide deacetylase family protein [Campylobacterota bacterium]|nr:divergent polysaccharide deacetylase family protein [Campylobacterota bacterium]
MAPKSKKSATTKKPIKKRRSKKRVKKFGFSKVFLSVSMIVMIISVGVFGYVLGKKDIVQERTSKPTQHKQIYTTLQLLNDLSNMEFSKPKEEHAKKEVIKKETAIKAKEPIVKKTKAVHEKVDLAYRGKKPKLVIIIDDVSSLKQLKKIKALPMKVTPSIFPPFRYAKTNHKLAKGLKNYMIHLPMESGKSFDKQHGTLLIKDANKKIKARVKEMRKLFPTARYVNNHTGSKFTSNYKAMYTLYELLRKEGFVFVDSRTVGTTKVRKVAHSFGDKYVGRDIFIDNKHTVAYIHKQLKKAVRVAKRKGYAIAIGHPHFVTMKALKSANRILKDVEIVYIDEIYKKVKK